ncbi:MAG: spermidine/putrescine transport system permease protein [Verrucomicrobiota bacterium]|jgi:spermidine/putrescine transport system permease protein
MSASDRTRVQRGEVITRRAELRRVVGTVAPGAGWLLVFFAIPLLLIVTVSFLSRGQYGTVEGPFTFENYRRLAGFGWLGFDPLYPIILLRSVTLGLVTTALAVLGGLPLAFFMARVGRRWKRIVIALVLIPFWTNLLVRTYAWQILLAPDGWLAAATTAAGLTTAGEALYPGALAVYACLVCDYLPFLVLPLYASVEKINWTLAEAARDLGANRWNVFRHAILPQIQPGLIAGSLLVFLPATGQFVIPDLLGGAKTTLLGNLVQQQFGPNLDWPFGSAIAVVSLVIVLVTLGLLARQHGSEEELA